jgi:hypothetical protein
LHFPDLPFAHQPHNGKEGDENNDDADKDKSHTVILRKRKKNIPETLAFLV